MIPFAKPSFFGKEENYVLDSLRSTWISDGPYIKSFERDLENKLDIKYVTTTSNGTSALHLAYLCLGISSPSKIIVPGFGFQAASNIAKLIGVTPVFADVDPDTWLVTDKTLKDKLEDDIKNIVVVHTYGNVVTLSDDLYSNYNIIEDCAESLFSKFQNKYVGSFGVIGTFSFHATKTITCGEGGALSTKNVLLYDKAKLLKSHGLKVRGSYDHEEAGHNFRMTNLQAALGLAQLDFSDHIINKRKQIYKWYRDRLENFVFQKVEDGVEPVMWAIALKVEKRDELRKFLLSKEIETRPGFTSPSELPMYMEHDLPISDDLAKSVIVLPTFTSMTESEVNYICERIKDFYK